MLLVQRGTFYSDEPKGRRHQSIRALSLVRKGAIIRWRWGAAFSWRKWLLATEALSLARGALTLVLRALKPGEWAPLQTEGAPATSKRNSLRNVWDAETPS